MLPLVGGLIAGLAPSVIDAITGVGAKRKKALDDQQREYDKILMELQNEIGPSVENSTLFRTSMAQLDKGNARSMDAIRQDQASTGLTDEATLSRITTNNDSYNTAEMGVLNAAVDQRKQLKDKYRRLTLEKMGLQVGQAEGDAAAQSQLFGNIAQALPGIIGDNQQTATGYNPDVEKVMEPGMAFFEREKKKKR